MQELIEDRWSQADVARELGVTRQVIQKMLSIETALPTGSPRSTATSANQPRFARARCRHD
jgi:transcriptional regulator with XRE-family HTH domain